MFTAPAKTTHLHAKELKPSLDRSMDEPKARVRRGARRRVIAHEHAAIL
jgi:hypothetical protein